MEKKRKATSPGFKVIQYILTVLIIAAICVLAYPFYPMIKYELGFVDETGVTVSGQLPSGGEEIPTVNTLVIPKIGVNIEIVEGSDDSALNSGAWRIPSTSTPDQGGNTVISAHRFRYLPPNNTTFYLLDKLQPGDPVIVYWNGEEFDYTVSESFEVDKTATEIQDNTEESQLTLFTCTPLFSTDKRLVIIADPKE